MGNNEQSQVEADDSEVRIYHVVYGHEDFNHAASALFELIHKAQQLQPGKARRVFLQIDGHRNSQGGFDADMYDLQERFLIGVLGRFVSEIHSPLISVRNPHPQDDCVPDSLVVQDPPDRGR